MVQQVLKYKFTFIYMQSRSSTQIKEIFFKEPGTPTQEGSLHIHMHEYKGGGGG